MNRYERYLTQHRRTVAGARLVAVLVLLAGLYDGAGLLKSLGLSLLGYIAVRIFLSGR